MNDRAPAVGRTAGAAGRTGGAPLHVVIVGHVDHGKSTLVGRLLHETGALDEGRVEAVAEMCRRRGMPFEWAFVTDALQAERDQAVTIDVSHIRFATERRPYVLLDAPGHREFIKNMVCGAASADAALLLIDAEEGVRQQSRRHGYLLSLLGVRQVAVVVNKMDLVGRDRSRFETVAAEAIAYLGELGVEAAATIPVSAREGDNIAAPSPAMPWYSGPTVLEALDSFATPPATDEKPLRLPVQDIYKFDRRRIIAGRIESGTLQVGDRLLFSPSNKVARVKSIEAWSPHDGATRTVARSGESVGITLDEQIFIERGEVASRVNRPPIETDVFRASVFWLGERPMEPGNRYTLKLNTLAVPVEVQSIERVIDTDDLSASEVPLLARNGVGEAVLRTDRIVALDTFAANPRTGRFVLLEGYLPVGGGTISMEGYPDQRQVVTVRATNVTEVAHRITRDMRAERNRHRGGVLWFTGLSGAGKSTLAMEVERRLFQEGYHVYVLDGDNVRQGLNANLGFSAADRAENIRRVGEVAALFADAGFVVITAFISPYRSDRARARAASRDAFHEIFIHADLEVCEARDPKGLYRRARKGEITDFTGISAPYEPPTDPELTIDTATRPVEDCVEEILAYVRRHFAVRTD